MPGCMDWREKIRPKVSPDFDPTFRPVPYYQVFADRNGFSEPEYVDLLFNLGPESRLILRDSIWPAPKSKVGLPSVVGH